jgi:hypothetical protein
VRYAGGGESRRDAGGGESRRVHKLTHMCANVSKALCVCACCSFCVSDEYTCSAGTFSLGWAPAGVATWDVRSALWKIKNWVESLGFGQGVKAFQVVYEALMDAAIQSGKAHAEGLTASMWQVALAKEGSLLPFTPALLDSTHAHLAAGCAAPYLLFEYNRTLECMRAACTPQVTREADCASARGGTCQSMQCVRATTPTRARLIR